MSFLYEKLDNDFVMKMINGIDIPSYVTDNMRFKMRPYQEESFKRYIFYCQDDDVLTKPVQQHLLYNMATGSGKTMIMAGMILYLYEKGYRNFLFFVGSKNIIEKTKDNFLSTETGKYLYSERILFGGKEVFIKEVDDFDEADDENINIKFSTVQKIHIDLNDHKEDGTSLEEFENKKVVLIGDEAHHTNAGTKSGDATLGHEGSVNKIFRKNLDNIFLEFTATIDYELDEIRNKYKDKIIQRYDLSQFREQKYSKEVNLFRSMVNEKGRIIQALILNLYREELATLNGINLKPVILFKAKKTIAESQKNKENFHQIIDNFSASTVDELKNDCSIEIINKAFSFFEKQEITSIMISKLIKDKFKEENCICANNDSEAERNQRLLNTLEDDSNPIRAVFAVNKLNEGWDVLNLFDIVRLYNTRDADHKKKNLGKTTISEAQLIGRGARYFPFQLDSSQDKFKRKFDDDITNDLKILEELYYHTKENSRYISELKKALVDQGIYVDEDDFEIKHLKLKPEFKETDFYKNGHVFSNKKREKGQQDVKPFSELNVKSKNFNHNLSSVEGFIEQAFGKGGKASIENKQKDIPISNIPRNIIRHGLSTKPFFHFHSLKSYYPKLNSISEFITSKNYLGGLEITFSGTDSALSSISNSDYLSAVQGLVDEIQSDIKSNLIGYTGSEYYSQKISEVFVDKELKIAKNSERSDGQLSIVTKPEWYVYNANYGTSLEKEFVKMFARRVDNLIKEFEQIYLIRNERFVNITDKLGRNFEPDFLLFCKKDKGEDVFQVFIEPKGAHLIGKDKWKEEFLKEILKEEETIEIDTDRYLILAVPFYTYEHENEFKENLEDLLIGSSDK